MSTTRRTVTATLVLAMAATAGGVAMATAEPAAGVGSTCSGTCDSDGTQESTRTRGGNGGAGMGGGNGAATRGGNGYGSGATGSGSGGGSGSGAGSGGRWAQGDDRFGQGRGSHGTAGGGQGMGGQGAADHEIAPAVPGATISDEVEAALLWLAEEEKLAGDVYDLAADHQDLRAFTNIGQAEDRHLASVQVLLERYGLADPTEGAAAGQFSNQALQDLYDELAAQVVGDRASAVAVGVQIEQADIADLEELLADEDLPADVVSVAENLLAGSQNHLAAFQRQS